MRGEFTAADGYTTRDLVTYARDHMASARVLFQKSFHCYDSAGYLSHLGIELPLKAFLSRSTEAPRRTRPEAPRAGAARGSHRARRRARRPGARPPRRCLTGRGRLHRPRRGRRRIGWRSGRPGASVAAHGAQRTHGGSGLADGSLHEEMGRLLGSRRRPCMAAARSSSHATRPHQTTVARSTIRRACMGRS